MQDLLLSTLRSLRAHKLRFGLTSLGIVWGALLLTFLSASIEGFADHFGAQLEATGPKVVIMFPGAVFKNRVGERGARPVELESDDTERLLDLHSVEDSAVNLGLWNQIVRAGRRTKLLMVQGVSERTQQIRNFQLAEGRFITPTDVERSARVVVLGHDAAQRLFGREPPLGRTLQIENVSFRVVGVTQHKGDQLMGVMGRDDLAVLVPYTAAQRMLLKHDRVDQVIFAPVTREATWDAIGHVRQLIGLHHDFPPDLDTALSFVNVQEVVQMLETLFFGLRIFLVAAGVITLLVGAIGVMNIMLVIVGERTQEIGLRKAVGASSRSIFLQFLAEAAAVSGISGVFGAGLGAALSYGLKSVAPPGTPIATRAELDPALIAIVVVSLVAVGIVAGVLPAVRAARIAPADALRSQ